MRRAAPLVAAIAALTAVFGWSHEAGGGPLQRSSDQFGYQPPPMRVSLIQVRTAEGSRRVAVRIANTGDQMFTVTGIRLAWPAVPNAPATAQDVDFAPGRVIDLTTTYGQPDCAGYPELPPTPPAVEVQLAGPGEPVVTRPLDPHGERWIERLYADECQRSTLEAVADVRLLRTWTRVQVAGTPWLRGWLVLDRVATSEPVTVRSLLGSVLLGLRPLDAEHHPVARLEPGQERIRLPVLLGSSGRCDAHGLAGSTQTFVLSAVVQHGTAPPLRLVMIPGPRVQNRVLDVVHDACQVG